MLLSPVSLSLPLPPICCPRPLDLTSLTSTHTHYSYSKEKLEDHLTSTWETAETKGDVAVLLSEMEANDSPSLSSLTSPYPSNPKETLIPILVKEVCSQVDKNLKTTGLKQLQGHIWKCGYENGALVGQMFPDIRVCLESWTRRGYRVCIYSSGSVAAQKLIFGYSEQGDLLPFLSAHFDTKIGAKIEKESYENIVKELEVSPERLLFVTDRYVEAVAADEAGVGM